MTQVTRSLLVLLVIFGTAGWLGCAAEAPPEAAAAEPEIDLAAEEEAVRQVNRDWLELARANDAEGIGNLFVEDGWTLSGEQGLREGRAAIVANLQQGMDDNPDQIDDCGFGRPRGRARVVDQRSRWRRWRRADGGRVRHGDDQGRRPVEGPHRRRSSGRRCQPRRLSAPRALASNRIVVRWSCRPDDEQSRWSVSSGSGLPIRRPASRTSRTFMAIGPSDHRALA
jgi:hypothetical protein